MLIKKPSEIHASEITDESVYLNRRSFIKSSAGIAIASGAGVLSLPELLYAESSVEGKKLKYINNKKYSTDETSTPYAQITEYNNFYEFGTDKYSPAKRAQALTTDPWSIKVEGNVAKPGTYQLEDILKPHTLEERIYRLRCVERWSMVVPWIGIPLSDVIKRFEPTSNAKFVEFTTLYRPDEMTGQKRGVLKWPYVEGLRIDEAMHPLTLLAVGLYGNEMPKQNGAPLRLVVPWKYGFKSIKSIVNIRFTEQQPVSAWTNAAPKEYGFYSNVNPSVDHPRWSQRRERRLGDFLKRKTELFNGYGDQVAHMYAGMDLKKYF